MAGNGHISSVVKDSRVGYARVDNFLVKNVFLIILIAQTLVTNHVFLRLKKRRSMLSMSLPPSSSKVLIMLRKTLLVVANHCWIDVVN